MKSWVSELRAWLLDHGSRDQDAEGKTDFVRIAKAGPVTDMRAVGVSSGVLKKRAASFFRAHPEMDILELEEGLRELLSSDRIIELWILSCYIFERYRRRFSPDLWRQLVSNWIPRIDHWAPADHLCINVLGHFQLEAEQVAEVAAWGGSDNFWMRRLSIVVYIKQVRLRPEAADQVLRNVRARIGDDNYYVRKAIPWLLREASKYRPLEVEEFLQEHIRSVSKTELREASKRLDENSVGALLVLYDRNG